MSGQRGRSARIECWRSRTAFGNRQGGSSASRRDSPHPGRQLPRGHRCRRTEESDRPGPPIVRATRSRNSVAQTSATKKSASSCPAPRQARAAFGLACQFAKCWNGWPRKGSVSASGPVNGIIEASNTLRRHTGEYSQVLRHHGGMGRQPVGPQTTVAISVVQETQGCCSPSSRE